MSIRFIYGRSGSGKSEFCINEIINKLKDGCNEPIYYIVPEQYSMQTEKKIAQSLQNIKVDRINCVEVLSFKRLTYKVFSNTGGPKYPVLSKTGKYINIYKALSHVKDKLKVFNIHNLQPGYIEMISNTISELKRYNINTDTIEEMEKLIDSKQDKIKISDLKKIIKEYENIINTKYTDPDEELNILKDKITTTKLFKDSIIYFDEFSGYIPQQFEIINLLLKEAKMLSFCFTTDCLYNDRDYIYKDIFSIPRKAILKITDIAKENNISITKPVYMKNNHRFKNEELIHFEKNLFNLNIKKWDNSNKKIKLYSAKNEHNEIEKCAQDIIYLCREKKYRYKDIAVITGNIETYEKIIKVVFDEYNIPYFLDSKKDIFLNKYIILILSIFEIIIGNWSYNSVFKFLKTGILNFDQNDIDILENFVLASGVRGNTWTDNNKWQKAVKYIEKKGLFCQDEIDRICNIRKEIINPIKRFKTKISNTKKVHDYCVYFYELLEDLELNSIIQQLSDRYKIEGKINLSDEYSKMWDIVIDVLEEVYSVFKEEDNLSFRAFYDYIYTALSSIKLGLIPPTVDQVSVGDIIRSKSSEIKALFLIGANDGRISSGIKDNGIISDSVRDELLYKGIELAPNSKLRTHEENFEIYSSLTKTSHYLYVYYSKSDIEGRSLRPSIIVFMIKNMFNNIDIEEDELFTNNINISLPYPTFKKMIEQLSEYVSEETLDDKIINLFAWFNSKKEWRERINSIFKNLNYTNQTDNLSVDIIDNIYQDSFTTTVSRLDQYVRCPFSYFLKYILKIKEREIFKLSFLDIGNFYHKILEKALIKIDYDNNYNYNDIYTLIKECINKELEKEEYRIFKSFSKNKFYIDKALHTISMTVYAIYSNLNNSHFRPAHYELAFTPMELKVKNKRIKIRGVVDRVDYFEDGDKKYLRIIDYKTGSRKFNLNDIYNGLSFQLITYLNAIIKSTEDKLIPSGMLYYNISNPTIKVDDIISDPIEREKKILKELKMNGLLINDKEVLINMDKNIHTESLFFPVSFNKNGSLHKRSSVATCDQIHMLCKYSEILIKNIVSSMLEGYIKILPYKKNGNTPCNNCNYKAICQFDSSKEDNKYKYIVDIPQDELWEKIEYHIKGVDS